MERMVQEHEKSKEGKNRKAAGSHSGRRRGADVRQERHAKALHACIINHFIHSILAAYTKNYRQAEKRKSKGE